MTLNPKAKFKESAHAKPWHDLTGSFMFQEAAMTALLHLQLNMPVTDLGNSAANYWQLVGARRLMDTLLNLTEKEPPQYEMDTLENLDHTV